MTTAKVIQKNADKTFTNSIGMEFVLIPAGSFEMGSPDGGGIYDEHPRHRVTITRPFYLGKYPVTQAQYEAVMGNNPSYFKGRNNPVEQVSWEDARDFFHRLNRREKTLAYCLPSEAQWEYAARAGSSSRYCFGDDESRLAKYAWYYVNSGRKTHPVGEKHPNNFGLHDMHGNVSEWCQDWYGQDYYKRSPEFDPRGPSSGEYRVRRDGSWNLHAEAGRSACRRDFSPGDCASFLGFRLLRTL